MTVAGRLDRVASNIRSFQRDWPSEGGQVVARAVETELRADTGGDGRLSNAPQHGAATVDVRASDGRADVEAGGSLTIWRWLTKGTGAHQIDAGEGRVLSTPYGPRRRVRVSGRRTTRPFARGADRARGAVTASARSAMSRIVS